jgi:all-trans-retinol 13,14-reductase
MTARDPEYLVVGSGLAALSFASLMARAGRSVRVVEAHDVPGGYGHTFKVGKSGEYHFNAQLHYVWNCGEGRTVNRVLRRLDLDREVTFERYEPTGFDHMRMPGHAVDIPSDPDELKARLSSQCPEGARAIKRFVDATWKTARELDLVADSEGAFAVARRAPRLRHVIRFHNATLQKVFDHYHVPKVAQTLLALQWPDFLLPPDKLSYFAWVMLFTGYCRGAYYPTRHFEHFIKSLVKSIESNGGEVILNERVVEFVFEGDRVVGVRTESADKDGLGTGKHEEHRGRDVICNMDPRRAAQWIGMHRFSRSVRRKLDYDYSPSNFMAYCVVEGIDLRDYGFGKFNLFHTEDEDLNRCFHRMDTLGDFSAPSFALTTPSLLTDDPSGCPEGQQLLELLTVANHNQFAHLSFANRRAYVAKKKAIFDSLIDIVERDYVPNLRKHICFKMLGTPTTNERYCLSPEGNSYGSNLTPDNVGPSRLDHRSGVPGLYFCNASSGYPGFAGTVWTGARLYERLTGDRFLA